MFLGLILANKIVAGLLIALVALPPVVYGGIKVNEYRQSIVLLSESKQLTQEGKYQEAIGKLTDAQSKWSLEETRKEIGGALEENKTLVQSSKDYELGKELFDKEKFKDALEILKKIDNRNINYPSARSLIELTEKKIDVPKGEVAGVRVENKITEPTAESTPTPSPSNAPSSTSQTQVVQQSSNPPEQHTDAYCKNEANLSRIKFYEIGSKDIQDRFPELFYYDKAREKFPDRYGSDPNNSIGYDFWLQESKAQKDAYYALLRGEEEKVYYKVYNQCLGY